MTEQGNEQKDSDRTHTQEPSEGDTSTKQGEQREHAQQAAEGDEDQS